MDRRLAAAVGLLVVVAGVAPLAVAPAGAQESVDCSFPVTVTDATGADVTVTEKPDRIVALAPSAAQQLWAVGAEDRVVGMPVNQYTAYLDGRDHAEQVVGDDGQPVTEEVVGLEPDLVLAPNVIQNETVESLRDAGLTVYRYGEARTIEDVYAEVERTGRLVGEFEAAAQVSAEMDGTVAAIRDAVADADRPTVYYDLGDGWTAGNATFVGDLIATAGGDNVASQAEIQRYDTISQEVLANTTLSAVIVHEGSPVPETPGITNATTVVRVDANFINQPGPRNVIPLRSMAAAFHPDAMSEANVDDPETPTPAQCAETDDPATVTTPSPGTTADSRTTQAQTTGGDGAGFTLATAAAALSVLGLLSRRR